MTTRIPVLLYHSVAETPPEGLDRWTLSRREFDEHLRVIADAGVRLLTVSQLVERLRAHVALDPPPVVVTFDDGWADFAGAAEQMAAYSIPSTLYATAGSLGLPGYLTGAALRQVAAAGVEVGAHGVTHCRLDELSPNRLQGEVHAARSALEDLLQRPVSQFAYPHGNYSARVRQAVQEAGYESAAAVKHAFSHPSDDIYAIARLMITCDMTAADVAGFLAGRGAPLAWRRERVRTKAYRGYRRVRHLLRGQPTLTGRAQTQEPDAT